MNRRILSIFVLAALFCLPCCISCTDNNNDDGNQEETPPPTPPDDQTKPEPKPEPPKGPQPGEYKFEVSALKGKWEAGDQIYVHGNYGPAAETITLAAEDISEDGKTATGKLDKVTEFPCTPDGLYAAWPGDLVPENDGLLNSSTLFQNSTSHVAVAYLKDDTFTFVDASCAFTFTVSGDFDGYAMADNNRDGIRISAGYQPSYSSTETKFVKPQSDGYPFIYGTVTSGGQTTIWFAGTATFKSGYTLFFGKDGSYGKSFTVSENVTIKPGEVYDAGDITASLQDYTGPAPKMPEMGTRTKFTVKFNELSGLCLSKDKDFLWGVDDNGGLGKFSLEGEVLWKKSYGGEFEAITMDPRNGDLLIGEETEPGKVTRFYSYPDYDNKEKLCTVAGTSFGNDGLEGLTYYKDGLAYAGIQTSSYLFLFELATGEVVWKKNLRQIFPVITEIADLCYDPLTDWLWIIDSESKRFFALTGDAESMLGYYIMKGTDNPEALCIDHEHSCVWVGDDYGSTSYIYKYEFTGLDDAIIE